MKRRLTILLLVIFWLAVPLISQSGFKLPEYQTFKLRNGLTVFLLEQHEVPLIYISLVLPAGAVKDGNTQGLASLTAESLLWGSKSHTKSELEESLDFLGVSYSSSASLETATLRFSYVNRDQEKVFPLFREIITAPSFPEEEFARRKKRLLMELEQAKESPAQVIRSYYNRFLYGGHPYGNPVAGTRSSLEKIELKDIQSFYTANYKPSQSAIAIVGDFKSRDMKRQIRSLLNAWRNPGKSAVVRLDSAPVLKEKRILLINKENASETRFQIGGFGITRSNPDYVGVQVINTILGGRFTSWLNDALRVNAGLTYGARSSFSTYRDSGTFAMSSYTRTAKTIEAIDLALEVYSRLHEQGIDEKTLQSAKNYIKGQYPPRYETAGSLAALLTSMYVYGFDESFINDFQENVDSLTVEKAREVIGKYFPKDNLQFVLIGKAAKIRELIKKYGKLSEKNIKDIGF